MEPVGGPVERAEECARGDCGVGNAQFTLPDAVSDQRANASLVSVPLGNDALAQPRRQRVGLEVRGRSLHFVEQTQDVRHGQRPKARGERRGVTPGGGERRKEPLEREILAEEEQLVLATEVVIQVAGRQIGGDGDVAHAGRGEPVRPKDARGRAQDGHTPRVGAS